MSAGPTDRSFEGLFGPKPDFDYFAAPERFAFDPAARGFHATNAWRLADLALLTYVPDEGRIAQVLRAAGAGDVRVVERGSTRAVLTRLRGAPVVAFRGTQPGEFADLRTDLRATLDRAPGGGRVHHGFRLAFEAVERALDDALGSGPAWWTGHSLGGALATVGAQRAGRARGLVTFGAPRVGDAHWVRRLRVDTVRIVHDNDFVPDLPPPLGYAHAGTLHWIDSDGHLHVAPDLRTRLVGSWRGHEQRLREALARRRAGEPGGLAWDPLVDHSPLLYALALRRLARA